MPPTTAGQNVLQLLDKVATDLQSGNRAALGGRRPAGRRRHARPALGQPRAGRRARRTASRRSRSRLKDLELNVEDLLSKTEDADMAKAMVDFSMQQSVYQAALQSGARVHPAVAARLPAVRSDMASVTSNPRASAPSRSTTTIVLTSRAGHDRLPRPPRYAILKQREDSVFMWLHSRRRAARWRSRSCCRGSSTGTTRSTCPTRTWRRSASSAPTRSRSTASSTWRRRARRDDQPVLADRRQQRRAARRAR